MLKIESDNPSIEKNLKILAKAIIDHDGYLDPDLVIRCENSEMSVVKEGLRDHKNPLIALPNELLLPAEPMGLTVKNDKLVLDIEKGSMTKIQEELTECMIEIYNQTDKIKYHKASTHWFNFQSAPEALEDLYKCRTINDNHSKYLAFTKGKDSDMDENEILCSSYLKTRTIGHKQTKKDGEAKSTGQEQANTTKIMPIIDFINHDFEGANFNFNNKGYKTDKPDLDFLLLQDSRPIINSGECFAFYNLLDAVDTFLNYGFPDARAPLVRSVPMDIDIPGAGKLIVQGYVSSWKKGPLNKNMANLRAFIPQTTKNDKDGDMEVSHLMIPSGSRFPHALRRVLRLLLSNKASKTLSSSQLWDVVLNAEEQILDANITFYKNLYEKYNGKDSKDEMQQRCYQQIAYLAHLQLTKLYNYEKGAVEDTVVANNETKAAVAG